MREEPSVVERARRDIADQRLWSARDRLASAVRATPTDQSVLEALGEVYYLMGDYPAAWRYWVLTGRRDSETAQAETAFAKRFGSDLANRLGQIPAREPLEDYPDQARSQLLGFRREAEAAGVSWPREASPSEASSGTSSDAHSGRWDWLVVGAVFLFTIGPWLIGTGFLIYLIGGSLIEGCTR